MQSKNDIVKWLWRLFFLFIAVNGVAFLLMSSGLIGYLPRIDELENPIDKYASQVISSDDQLLFTYSQSDENRIFVSYNELSPYLIHALVATEDRHCCFRMKAAAEEVPSPNSWQNCSILQKPTTNFSVCFRNPSSG